MRWYIGVVEKRGKETKGREKLENEKEKEVREGYRKLKRWKGRKRKEGRGGEGKRGG